MPALSKEERCKRQREQRQREVNEAREARIAAFEARCKDPLTRQVAYSICTSIYGSGKCACEKRPDLSDCSTMSLAALGAIRVVRGDGQYSPERK